MTTTDSADQRGYEDIQALYELAAALARAEDADQVCERALHGVRQTLRADRASVLLLDEAGVMRFRAWHGLSDAYRAAVEGHSPWPRATRDATPVMVTDVEADPALEPLRDVLRTEGIRACAFIPISYGERLLGKYMLYFDEPRELTAEEVDVARAVADHIAVAVDRKTVERELRESRDQLRAILGAVSDAITVQRDTGELLFANDEAARMLGLESAEELVRTPVATLMERFQLLDARGEPLPIEALPARRVLAGEPAAMAILRYRVHGKKEERWSEVRATPVRDAEGKVRLAVNVFRDVTARRRWEEWQRLLTSAGDALAHSLEVEPSIERVARLAIPELADWCAVDLVDDDGSIENAAVAHVDPTKLELVRRLRTGIVLDTTAKRGVGAVVRTGEAELYPKVHQDLVLESSQDDEHVRLVREVGLYSTLIVPLRARGRMLGALSLVWGESQRSYDHEDLAFAEELGRRVAVAVDNARLHHAEQEARAQAEAANERLHHLERIAEIGLESRSVDELLERLLVYVRDLLDGDRATMLLLDQDRHELVVRAAVGLDEQTQAEVHVPLGKGIAGTIATTRRAQIVEDVVAAGAISAYLRRAGGSLVGVPLVVEDRVLGVLHVSADRKGAFRELDAAFLDVVGERVALAIDRTAAYEHEHKTALTLQQSVLPDELPQLERADLAARYIPGSAGVQVGGDWYDVLKLPRGRIGLVVGDVVGKGVEAAAAMTEIRNALRVYALEGLKPSTVIARLNDLTTTTFATVLYAVVDLERGVCRYANAGHPPPLLLRADGKAKYLEGGRAAPLGVEGQGRAKDDSVDLEPGDTLLFYTDGLVESRRQPLEGRLALLLRSLEQGPAELEALLDHLIDSLVDADALPDDVALLAFRLLPTSRGLHLTHPSEPAELASIRDQLRGWLANLGVPPADQLDLVLACNELCTNAIEHAQSPTRDAFEVVADSRDGEIALSVTDFGSWREPTRRDGRGAGLLLVRALVDALEIVRESSGTRVNVLKRLRVRAAPATTR